VLPVMLLTLAVATAAPASAEPPSGPIDVPSAKTRTGSTTENADRQCPSEEGRNILVCAQRRHPYRLDSDVLEAGRKAESNSRSATAAIPPAQAVCAASPAGCGNGLGSLDLANVAIIAGTMAIDAASGRDWLKPFRPGGPGEYQLYQQAKKMRETQETERAAAEMKAKAQQAEREAAAGSGADSK
jgi:hypothetical protein